MTKTVGEDMTVDDELMDGGGGSRKSRANADISMAALCISFALAFASIVLSVNHISPQARPSMPFAR